MMKETGKRVLAMLLALSLLMVLMPAMSVEAEAASIVNINDNSVFLKQNGGNTCTLVSALMMFRRGALLNNNERWSTFTEANYKSANKWWTSGMVWSPSGEGMSGETYALESNYNLKQGDVAGKKALFINLLREHKEGVVIYFWKQIGTDSNGNPIYSQHASLLTDYDSANDVFYCADPSPYVQSGRIPLSYCSIKSKIKNAGYSQGTLSDQDYIIGYINQIWMITNGVKQCDHSSGYDSLDKCKGCGLQLDYTQLRVTASGKTWAPNYQTSDGTKQVIITTACNLRNAPYNNAKDIVSWQNKGAKFTLLGIFKNSVGNTWYEVARDNSEKGYIYSSYSKIQKLESTLKVEQPAGGYTIQQGNPVNITGSISSNYQLNTISATVDGKNYLDPTPISGIKSNPFSIYCSNVNYQLKGATLSVGVHELKITATDESGASRTASTTIQVNANQVPKVYAPTIKVINEYIGGKRIRIQQQSSGAKLTYYCATQSNRNIETYDSFVDFDVEQDVSITAFSSKNGQTAYYGGAPSTPFYVSVPQLNSPSIQITPKPDGAIVSIVGSGDIYYNVNGSMNQKYYQPFTVAQSCTINAFAQKEGYQTSWTTTETFTSTAPARPEISLLSTSSDIAVGEAITVRWDAIALASSYTVHAFLDGVALPTQTISKNSATVAASESGVYTVSVTANNAFGSSAQSSTVRVTAHDPSTVTFVSDDEVLSSQSVRYGGDAIAPASPTKKGYTFTGWSQNLSGITRDTTIEAQYRINMYTIRFYQSDGTTLIDSITIPYGSTVDTTEIENRVTMKHDFNKFVGWHITESDADSGQSLSFVDCDMVLVASQKWAEESLPIGVRILSAVRNDAATGYDIRLSLYAANADILNPDRQDKNTAIKAKIIAVLKTSNGQMLASEMATVNLAAGAFDTEKTLFISYNGSDDGSNYIADTVEISVVGIDGNDRTGGALAQNVSAHPTVNIYYSNWMEESALPAAVSNVESKTQYRYTDSHRYTITRSNTSGSAPSISDYNLINTTSEWGSWSSWSDSAVSSSSNRQVETRQVLVTAAYTQYRYGRWKSGSGNSYCNTTAKKYYGGTPVLDYTSWSTTRYRCVETLNWTCGNISGYGAHNHVGVAGTYSGGPLWSLYSADGSTSVSARYFWEETQTIPASYKTQYRYRDKNYTYTYEKWTTDSPSAWSDTIYSGYSLTNSRRVVDTRQLYRYQTTSESESIIGTITEQTVTGMLSGAADDLAGKRATYMVYKQTNSDPTEPQLEYIGQTTIGDGNTYSFTFRPKEEPSVETGDFVVALAVQGCTNVVNVDKISAPKKQYHVTFYDFNNQILSEQMVETGQGATIISAPTTNGYSFVCWDTDISYITHDVEVHGVYWPDNYSVVFVDHVNGTVALKTDYIYGEQLWMPDQPTHEGIVFEGWEAISNRTGETLFYLGGNGELLRFPDSEATELPTSVVGPTASGDKGDISSEIEGQIIETIVIDPGTTAGGQDSIWNGWYTTVKEDMIIVANWTPIRHRVQFMSQDGSIIQSTLVSHGEAAQPPEFNNIPEDMVFLGWNTDVEWWNVTSDLEVYPIIAYAETAVMPSSNMSAYSEGAYSEITLEAEEGAIIYYTLDGSNPSLENVESGDVEEGFIRDEDTPVTYVYDGTLELTDSAYIRAISVVDGKNDSDIIEIEFVYNDENQGQLDYDDAVELGTYNVVAEPGKTITLSFDIHDNPGLLAYAFTVEADPTVFGVVYDEETYEADIVPGTVCSDKGTALLGNYQEGVGWQILWFGTSAAEGDGTLCTIQLQIADDAEEGKVYPVTVRYSPANTISEQDFEEDLTGKVAVSTFGDAGVLGDVNSDGYITTIDVVRIARYLIDDITFTRKQLAAADVTGDGNVTAADVIRLARYLVGLAELN